MNKSAEAEDDKSVIPRNASRTFSYSGTDNVFAFQFQFTEETPYAITADSVAMYGMDNKAKTVQIFWYRNPGEIPYFISQVNSAHPHYEYHINVNTTAGSYEETQYDHKTSWYEGRNRTINHEIPPGEWTFFYMYPASYEVDIEIVFQFERNVTFLGNATTSAGFLVDERHLDSSLSTYAAFPGATVKATCSFEIEHGFFGIVHFVTGGAHVYHLISPDGERTTRIGEDTGPEYWAPGTWTIEITVYASAFAAILVGGVDMRLPGHPDGPAVNEHPAVCAR